MAAGGLQGQRTTVESWTPEINSKQARNQETPENPEPVFFNVYGAQESIPTKKLIPPAYVAWRASANPPRFLAPIDSLKIPAQR